MTDRDQSWSRRIALAEVPEQGLHVVIEADAGVRAALMRTANLRDLPRLEASFDLRRRGVNGLQVTGEVVATVGQNCVVTLEPVEQNLHEAIDVTFAPGPAETLGNEEGAASFGMTDAEPPEPLPDGIVDLGAIATEYFLLGIDPYPRKAGAVFESGAPHEPADSPFSALEALRDPAKKPPSGRK
ncbi:YceD family protein [Pseudorhodoplanes sp.]|uniref:YceD family protein n=1 Tax=Pseudorhodoplanes sp. TaxID=1934341 RepID=UPI003D0AD237